VSRITRAQSLALLGGALLLPRCSGRNGARRGVLRVGSKDFGENIVVAEIYAQRLEQGGFTVERHLDLGSTQIATEAIARGDIDLYPEYTGTGLIDVLHLAPMRNARALYERVKRAYAARYRIAWLAPSPGNDSQGLAVTEDVSRRYSMTTLSECSRLAPQLRLAAIPEFVSRADALPGLQRFYGGFRFHSVKTYDIGLQYDALVRGDADVATAFTTDSQIQTDGLVLLGDDRHFWPAYNIAPLVRMQTLHRDPRIPSLLNPLTARLTTAVLRAFNVRYNVRKADPAQIARSFLAGEHA
jgi:osmoprotectant transport system substrate-binding protein